MNPLSFLGGSLQAIMGGAVGGLAALGKTANQLVVFQEQMIKTTKAVNSQFVQLANSGNGGINSAGRGAVGILGSAISTLLTPVTGVLAAMFLTLADVIMKYVVPSLMEFIKWLGRGNNNPATSEGRAGLAGRAVGWFAGKFAQGQNAVEQQGVAGLAGGGAANAAGFLNEVLDGFIKNLEVVTKEMQIGLGRQGQVGFSGIAEVWKQVQMKAFMSPFEQKQLEMEMKQIGMMRELINSIKNMFNRDGNNPKVGGDGHGRIGGGDPF